MIELIKLGRTSKFRFLCLACFSKENYIKFSMMKVRISEDKIADN